MYIRAARFIQDLRGLSPEEKTIAYTMSVHASPPPQFLYESPADESLACIATMSMSTLARESGLANRETASRIVKRLVGFGIIAPVDGTVSKGGGHGEKTRTTAYVFTMTVKPDSGITLTSAAEERAARASVTQPENPPTNPPENRGECDSAVTLEPENIGECDSPVTLKPENEPKSDDKAKASVTPQSHEGSPSSSFRDFSESSIALEGSGGSIGDEEDARSGSDLRAAPQTRSAPTKPDRAIDTGGSHAVVVGEKSPAALAHAGVHATSALDSDNPIPSPSVSVSRNPLPLREPSSSVGGKVLPSSDAEGVRQVKGSGNKIKSGGQEEQDDANDRMEAEWRRRQLDRRLTNKQICDEFKSIFDRLCQQETARERYRSTERIKGNGKWIPNPSFDEAVLNAMPNGIDLTWKPPTPKQQNAAAEYFKAVGRDVAMAEWEKFLRDGDHQVTQPIYNEETGKVCGSEEMQQDWLLYIFVNEQTASVEGEKS